MSVFTDQVLKVVRLVPYGKVASYGQVALMVGVPRAAIQVGWVLHQHGDDVPWWRVINSKGRISTSCMEHTAALQKSLLESEGVEVSEDMMIDMGVFRYAPSQEVLDSLN
ncbi:MAG: MGMT family protein [Patescibacteria group bacterium]|jgi:methylated-DNA-protein-cysteine methyltransferase-like protein